MKRTLLFLLLAALAAAPTFAQATVESYTLALNFDLDGEAADADQVIAATALVDNGTSVGGANWTILAQPDVCRLLDITISDTDMTAGTITVVGTGCMAESRSCAWSAWTAGDDDGVKTLVCTDGEGAYFQNVATVTTGVMTGESDETFTLGYTANSVNGWAMYGVRLPPGPNGEDGVDPFSSYPVPLVITTAGAPSTTVTSVASNGAFTHVSVGDLLLFNLKGVSYERKVTARASANSITVNAAINIPAVGNTFSYKKPWFSTNPLDIVAIPVKGWSTLLWTWGVAANANTGGVISLIQCTPTKEPNWSSASWVQVSTTTVASAGTLSNTTESIDLTLLPYAYCRFGLRFGTGDDTDVADENISLSTVLMK